MSVLADYPVLLQSKKKKTLFLKISVVAKKVQKCLKKCPHREIVQSIKYFLFSHRRVKE